MAVVVKRAEAVVAPEEQEHLRKLYRLVLTPSLSAREERLALVVQIVCLIALLLLAVVAVGLLAMRTPQTAEAVAAHAVLERLELAFLDKATQAERLSMQTLIPMAAVVALAQSVRTLHQILWVALAALVCCLSSVDQQRITAAAVVVGATEETEPEVLAVMVAEELVAISLLHLLALQQTQAAVVAAGAETMSEHHWEDLELSLCRIQAHQEELAEPLRLRAETPSIHLRLVERW